MKDFTSKTQTSSPFAKTRKKEASKLPAKSSFLDQSKHKKHFGKRSYNFRTLVQDFRRIQARRKYIKKAFQTLSPGFIERIMLACTSVNGCKYCAWGHAYMALRSGTSPQLIKAILNKDLSGVPKEEISALLFAQHYAETCGYPEREAIRELVRAYGKEKAELILTVILMINFGNLSGNTIDAFESRIRGYPPEDGSWLLEAFLFFAGGAIFKKIVEHDRFFRSIIG